MKKAQGGIEAVMILGVVFFIFLGLYGLYAQKSGEIANTQEELKEKEECLNLATAITNIFLLGEGAEISVFLHREATVDPMARRIEIKETFCTLPITAVAQEGAPSGMLFLLSEGLVHIQQNNSVVVIENV